MKRKTEEAEDFSVIESFEDIDLWNIILGLAILPPKESYRVDYGVTTQWIKISRLSKKWRAFFLNLTKRTDFVTTLLIQTFPRIDFKKAKFSCFPMVTKVLNTYPSMCHVPLLIPFSESFDVISVPKKKIGTEDFWKLPTGYAEKEFLGIRNRMDKLKSLEKLTLAEKIQFFDNFHHLKKLAHDTPIPTIRPVCRESLFINVFAYNPLHHEKEMPIHLTKEKTVYLDGFRSFQEQGGYLEKDEELYDIVNPKNNYNNLHLNISVGLLENVRKNYEAISQALNSFRCFIK